MVGLTECLFEAWLQRLPRGCIPLRHYWRAASCPHCPWPCVGPPRPADTWCYVSSFRSSVAGMTFGHTPVSSFCFLCFFSSARILWCCIVSCHCQASQASPTFPLAGLWQSLSSAGTHVIDFVLPRSIIVDATLPRVMRVWPAVNSADFWCAKSRQVSWWRCAWSGLCVCCEVTRLHLTLRWLRLRRWSCNCASAAPQHTPVYTCVVDWMSPVWRKRRKHPSMNNAKGWVRFPSLKKERLRRKWWESRCMRGPGWRASRYHVICFKHFMEWEYNVSSQAHTHTPSIFCVPWMGMLTSKKKKVIVY